MLSKWEQSDDLKKYTATTTYTVYEVNLSDQGAGWILRRRKRAWGGHDDEWTVLGAVRSPDVAFKLAGYDAEVESCSDCAEFGYYKCPTHGVPKRGRK